MPTQYVYVSFSWRTYELNSVERFSCCFCLKSKHIEMSFIGFQNIRKRKNKQSDSSQANVEFISIYIGLIENNQHFTERKINLFFGIKLWKDFSLSKARIENKRLLVCLNFRCIFVFNSKIWKFKHFNVRIEFKLKIHKIRKKWTIQSLPRLWRAICSSCTAYAAVPEWNREKIKSSKFPIQIDQLWAFY